MIHDIIPRMPQAKKQSVRKSVKANSSADSESPKEGVQARLAPEVIKALDELAEQNGITRASVIAIACTRLVKTGI